MSRRVATSAAAIIIFPLLYWLMTLGKIPSALLWLVFIASPVAFLAYGFDKRAAMRNMRRTPESTLHLLALLGGWPGALIAQQVFRHKTAKRSFQTTFWFMVMLNCSAVALALWGTGVSKQF